MQPGSAGTAYVDVQGDFSGLTSAIQSQVGGLTRKGEGLGGAIKKGLEVGLAGAAGLIGASINEFTNFNRQMTLVQTQAGASAGEVKNLTGQVLELAKHSEFGPTQLAQGLFRVESAGFRGQKAIQVLTAAQQLAAVGQSDLESTTFALTAALDSGIKGTETMAGTVGTLNAAVGLGNMHMDDLVGALKTGILPAAANFGLALSDVTSAIDVMTRSGVPAELAATRLRMAITLLGAPSAQASKLLTGLGLSTEQAGIQSSAMAELLKKSGLNITTLAYDLRQPQGLLVALEDLKKHIKDSGLNAEEASALLTRAFGGARQASAILTLVGHTDQLRQILAQTGKQAGQFGADLAATEQTPAFKFKNALANIQVALISLGAKATPIAAAAIKHLVDVITDPRLSTQEKLSKIGDLIGEGLRKAMPVIVGFMGKMAVAGAEAFVGGFLHAGPLGQLVVGYWLLNKFGGLGAFRKLGMLGGTEVAKGITEGSAGGQLSLFTDPKPIVRGFGAKLATALRSALRAGMVGLGAYFATSLAGSIVGGDIGNRLKHAAPWAGIGAAIGFAVGGPVGAAIGAGVAGGVAATMAKASTYGAQIGDELGKSLKQHLKNSTLGGLQDVAKDVGKTIDRDLKKIKLKPDFEMGPSDHLDLQNVGQHAGQDLAAGVAKASRYFSVTNLEKVFLPGLKATIDRLGVDGGRGMLLAIKSWADQMVAAGRLTRGAANKLIGDIVGQLPKLGQHMDAEGKSALAQLTKELGTGGKQSIDALQKQLGDRRLVATVQKQVDDISGPHGWDFLKQAAKTTGANVTAQWTATYRGLEKIVHDTAGKTDAEHKQMHDQAVYWVGQMQTQVPALADKTRRDFLNQTKDMKDKGSQDYQDMVVAAEKALENLGMNTDQALTALGVKAVGFSFKDIGGALASVGGTPQHKQRGGLIQYGQPGDRGPDSILTRIGGTDVMVAPGEQAMVLTGDQQAAMNAAWAPLGGLPGFFRAFDRPHGAQRGGVLPGGIPRFAQGGAVQAMINEANAITSHHYGYQWGGGHAVAGEPTGGPGPGYDCSGAVSAVLHAAGLLQAPLVSGALASWGLPGPGPVTIYANDQHTYMSILGRYFGTSLSNPGGGADWFNGSPRAGFAVRHAPVTGSGDFGSFIKKVQFEGPKGALTSTGQGAIDAVYKAANAYVMKKFSAQGAAGGGNSGDGPGSLVTASWFSGTTSRTGANPDTTMGFAELSNPPGSGRWNALGGLPDWTRINVTYNGKTITIPRIDVGNGGSAISPATVRGIDFTPPAKAALNFPDLANVTWQRAGGGSVGGAFAGATGHQLGGLIGAQRGLLTPAPSRAATDTRGTPRVKHSPKAHAKDPTGIVERAKKKGQFKPNPDIPGMDRALQALYDRYRHDDGAWGKLATKLPPLETDYSFFEDLYNSTDETLLIDLPGGGQTINYDPITGQPRAVFEFSDLIARKEQIAQLKKAMLDAARKVEQELTRILNRIGTILKQRRNRATKLMRDVEALKKVKHPSTAQQKQLKDAHKELKDLTGHEDPTKDQILSKPDDPSVLGRWTGQWNMLWQRRSDVSTQVSDLNDQVRRAFQIDIPTLQRSLAKVDPSELQKQVTPGTAETASERADLLQQQLDESRLTNLVLQRQYGALRSFPPFGGSFADGGIVPGPVGEPVFIRAHGGERVQTIDQQRGDGLRVVVEDHRVRVFRNDVEAIVDQRLDQKTRGQSRFAQRALPGARG